ncbi:MAG: hypothetical protein LH467_15020 [Gemmatimonadaceae bacterium]|nr:hypothetical protein [Gemmatimonadaceae bacterium]
MDGKGVHSVASTAGGPPAIPNLFVTLDARTSPGWIAWYEDFVLKGNGGAAREKSLALELRGANGVSMITLKGHGVGIVSLRARELNQPRRVTLLAELYVTRLEMVGPGAVSTSP